MAQHSDATGVGRYVALLRAPHVAALLGWGMVARLPLGMAPLALLLIIRGEGSSYAAAGGVAAAYAVALGVGAPIAGRQVDRHGQAHVLAPRAIVYPCLLVVVGGLALGGVPIVFVAVAAAAAGASFPPVAASVRTLLPSLLPPELRSAGFALEASAQEVFFVGGPLFVALLATIHPVAALAGAAFAVALGTLALVRVPPVRTARPAPDHDRSSRGALAAVGVRTILVLATFMGLAFGLVEVAMPAFAEQHGSRALAGLALAAFSVGSLVGGLAAGLRPATDAGRQLIAFAWLLPVGLALPLLAASIPTMCLLLFLGGLPIAPLVTAVYGLVARVAPAGAHAETFAWIGTAVTCGLAGGTAAGGWLVDAHGVRSAIAAGVVTITAGAVAVTLRRRSLAGQA
jgi:MFS family permease